MFGSGDMVSYFANMLGNGSNGPVADKPENWSEERLDMEIQSELERLGLTRWTARAGGFGSSFAVGRFLRK